jgi:hypothetical protein
LQVAIAAGWDTLCILFLWVLMMAVPTPTPKAARTLPAVYPNVTRTLIIVALYKPVLGSVSFDLYNYAIEYCQFEDFWSFFVSLLE